MESGDSATQTVPMVVNVPKNEFTTSPPVATSPSAPKYGTMIPSRIFVGGIDFKTTEEDLRAFFSKFGSVRDARIIRDRAEVSKGYGFVTYDAEESVNNALAESENLVLHSKKLNIGRAVRKQPVNNYMSDQTGLNQWMLHPAGFASLAHQSGVTYYVAANGPHMTPYPGYTVGQNGMLAAPLTYVRNSQTSALHYNQQIMSRMVPYTGALPPFYAPPTHAAPYLQPHMFNYYAHPEFAQAAEGGESTGSFDGDQTGYQTKFTFGDHGVAQLTPPSTPQETTFN